MLGEQQAILRRPPHKAGSGHIADARKVAFTASSTSAQATGASSASGGCFVTMVATQDVHVCFGDANVGAATTADMIFKAGVEEEFWCNQAEETHFRAIRDAADGDLYWWVSGF